VALARALAPQPPIILFDEPFSGLDTRLRDKVRDETLHILKASGTAALLVTHDAEEAMFMADRIGIMHEGRLVQFGKPEDLYFKPKNTFVAEFFGEMNKISGVVKSGIVSTPLGKFTGGELEEGRTVEILIRPELLKLKKNTDASGLKGRVVTSRLLGRTSLIHLSVCKQGRELHLHSRMPGRYLPDEEEEVHIEFDPIHAFVFPLETKC
jgi:iron(III) transport system ATP-binding protein